MPEFIQPQDGYNKQDRENQAAKRSINKYGIIYSPLGVVTLMDGNQDTSIPGINVAEVCVDSNCNDTRSIHTTHTMGYTNVERFSDSRDIDLLHQWPGGWLYINN